MVNQIKVDATGTRPQGGAGRWRSGWPRLVLAGWLLVAVMGWLGGFANSNGVFALNAAQAAPGREPMVRELPRQAGDELGPSGALSNPLSYAGEGVYARAKPKLLQVRTVVAANGNQSSIGSGFLVGRQGLAITNYHVVSQFALEPGAYRLESLTVDGVSRPLVLLAIDVIHDLAVVQLRTEPDNAPMPVDAWFDFSERALREALPKGERLFAMGNPLDLGFTIVEGTYNGLVAKSYEERIHFSGAINPGMSGGPVVTSDGRVVGINVAKRLGSDLVSFLVPAKYAAQLLQRVDPKAAQPESAAMRDEIGRQLLLWQQGLFRALGEHGLGRTKVGPYEVADLHVPWISCWAQTNAGQTPAPKVFVNATECSIESQIFISGSLTTGELEYRHAYFKSDSLNAFQFAHYLGQRFQPPSLSGSGGKRMSPQRCHQDVFGRSERSLQQRVVLCARAYRDFPELYDLTLTQVTQDRDRQAISSQLVLRGVAWRPGLAFAKDFIEATREAKP